MIDFVNVVKGSIATDEALSHVIPGLGTPLGPGLELAGRFRERLDLPVFHAARIADVATARYAIAEGLVDMVGMMRAHMADPHIVRKLEAGQADRIRPCVGVVVLPQPDLRRSRRAVHPQRGDRARGDDPAAHGPEHRSAPDGRGRGGRTGRSGGGPRRGRARSPGRPVRGGLRSGRADPPRGARDAPARGPHRDRRLARGRVPARGGRAAVRHRGRRRRCDGPGAGRGGRRDRRGAADARPDRGRGPGREHLGHHRRGGHAVTWRGPRVRRPRRRGRAVVRRADGRGRVRRSRSSRPIATWGSR